MIMITFNYKFFRICKLLLTNSALQDMAKMTEDMYPTQTTSIPTEGRLLHPKEEETKATTCLTSSIVLILEYITKQL